MKLPAKIQNRIPEFLRNIKEFSAITNCENQEFKQAEIRRRVCLQNTFIEETDNEGICRWESMLQIQPKDSDTLEDRRVRILSCINGELPYTFEALCQKIINICGNDKETTVELYPDIYTLKVRIGLDQYSQVESIKKLFNRIVPCNIVVDFDLKYNTYEDLRKYRYGQLRKFTYWELRNKKITDADVDPIAVCGVFTCGEVKCL
jgi:hypothetical protein|nr:MAG TPA: tail protein [Caudoviricetes sp.]